LLRRDTHRRWAYWRWLHSPLAAGGNKRRFLSRKTTDRAAGRGDSSLPAVNFVAICESSPARAMAVADAMILANFAGIMKINLIKYAKFANNSFEMGV